jgi:hypothetical protein
MREMIEFRIPEEHAARWLKPTDGLSLGGSVRKLILNRDDRRIEVIADAESALKREGRSFFTAWKVRRFYARRELEAANLFRLRISAVFEPAGELCGTRYDETNSCSQCGAGARQLGPLFLDVSRIPKGRSFAKTIAGEVVVSQHVVDRFQARGVSGARFHPVRHRNAKSLEPTGWSQLVISPSCDIVPPTKTGIDPFDDDANGISRCPLGDLVGLNLLSEVSVR